MRRKLLPLVITETTKFGWHSSSCTEPPGTTDTSCLQALGLRPRQSRGWQGDPGRCEAAVVAAQPSLLWAPSSPDFFSSPVSLSLPYSEVCSLGLPVLLRLGSMPTPLTGGLAWFSPPPGASAVCSVSVLRNGTQPAPGCSI